jgi:hypothetical protein
MKLIFTEISPPDTELEMAVGPPVLRAAVASFFDSDGHRYERVIQESGRELWYRMEIEN